MPARRSSDGLEKVGAYALLGLLVIYGCVTCVAYVKITQMETGRYTPVGQAEKSIESGQIHERKTISVDSLEQLQQTFPIHVGKDVEEIVHPGYHALRDEMKKKWPSSLPTNMTVPKFFEDSHGHFYAGGSIRDVLGHRGEELMTPSQAAQVGSKITVRDTEVETIYCSVASYRDPECTGTVADVFERAEYPERIRIAILDQRTSTDPICGKVNCESHPDHVLCKYAHLIEYTELDARLSCGPVFARHLAHRHYRGEYFAMQIDSHVRFVEHWDSLITRYWHEANNEMAVLTTYLSDIHGAIDPKTHQSNHHSRPIMCASDYEGFGVYRHLRHGQQPEGTAMITGEPTLEPFWAAGFSFSRGHFVIQVPYDQHLPMVFQGEEISIGLRGFTYGYDYYTPEEGVCFHMYAIKENEAKRKRVPLFWENNHLYSGVGTTAMKRLNTIIGMEDFPRKEWVTDEEVKYGLGKVRSPNKFFETFGIHVEKHMVEKHLCRFVGKPMMKLLKPVLREDRMGLDYGKVTYKYVDTNPTKPFDNNKAKRAFSLSQEKQKMADAAKFKKFAHTKQETPVEKLKA